MARMKHFNQKHEAIFDCSIVPLNPNAKQGEIVLHKKRVDSIYFYRREFVNKQEVFLKIFLTKEEILDMTEEIKNIESQNIECPFDDELTF